MSSNDTQEIQEFIDDEFKDPFTAPTWFWVVIISFAVLWLVFVPLAWIYYSKIRSINGKLNGRALTFSILTLVVPFFGLGPPIEFASMRR